MLGISQPLWPSVPAADAAQADRLRELTAARTVVRVRRVAFVDAARGIAVAGMLIANMVNVFLRDIPPVLQHNVGDSLRMFDFPSPAFQLLVGVSLTLFLRGRHAVGRTTRQAQLDALRRFLLLIGLGVVLDGVGALSFAPHWGVLQTLGFGGAFAILVVDAPLAVCLGVMAVLLAVFSGFGNGVVHGSPEGALAFVPLTLAGLVIGRAVGGAAPTPEFVRRATCTAIAGFGLAATLFLTGVPFNKVVGTSSFVALTTGATAALLAGLAAFEARGRTFPVWLLLLGRDALTAWVLLYVLVYYPAWIVFPGRTQLALAPGLVAAVTVTVGLSVLTIALGRRGLRVRL
jgi:hypothetical protein